MFPENSLWCKVCDVRYLRGEWVYLRIMIIFSGFMHDASVPVAVSSGLLAIYLMELEFSRYLFQLNGMAILT